MRKLLTGILLAFVLVGCNSSKKVVYMQDIALETPIAIENYNEIKVRPGDMLQITVTCSEPALAARFNPMDRTRNQQTGNTIGLSSTGNNIGVNSGENGSNSVMPYLVDSAGDIDFPILGKLHVAGMTREQIMNLIKNRIKAGNYIQDPMVNVVFMNLHYSMLGEVTSPGEYFIGDDKITILEALAKAGDLTIMGKRDAVYVTRSENGQRTTYKLDLTSSDIYNSPVFYLQQDDIVYVEPNGVRAGQSTINENSFKSVGMWMSIASFLMSLSVLVFK